MTFPDDPVGFLQDCTAWWEWVQQAHPDEIDRYPENGHIHYRKASPWYQPMNAPRLIVIGGEVIGGEVTVPSFSAGLCSPLPAAALQVTLLPPRQTEA
jgi:hypothetical protein